MQMVISYRAVVYRTIANRVGDIRIVGECSMALTVREQAIDNGNVVNKSAVLHRRQFHHTILDKRYVSTCMTLHKL